MALKTKKNTTEKSPDLSATVRDILNTGKEDTKKVAEEVKKETEKVKMATAKAAAETKAKAEEKKEKAAKKTGSATSTVAAKAKAATKRAAATARKATTAAKEAAEAKDQDPKVIIQFAGNDYNLDDILREAKRAYSKKSKKAFKDLRVYIKPEERKAYFVADDNFGSVDF